MPYTSPMRLCPQCNTQYDDGVRSCPRDGRRVLPESVIRDAQNDPMMGATVAERYAIIGKVGAGGMGTVYRAEQAPIQREVALKVLRKDLGRDPETAARFHREARTLSQLKHPNTVHIIDFGQTSDGLLFLAMELLEGEMLSQRLKRVGPLEVPTAIRIASGVLRSLAEAHTRGIIHRDLKPDNIFLAKVHGRPEEDEVVKVVDFGIAKIRDGDRSIDSLQTQEGTVFGTPRYMSPEQAQGKTLDGRSDLYAVGVLLFHMLTGHPPFTDDDAVVVMAHHIKTVPRPVRQVAPARPIPASLEAVVKRAVEKDPDKRPQSAEIFLAEIEACLEEAKALAAAVPVGTNTPTPPPVSAVRLGSGSSRRTMVLGAGAIAILLGSVSALAIAKFSRPGGPRVGSLAQPSASAPSVASASVTAAPTASETLMASAAVPSASAQEAASASASAGSDGDAAATGDASASADPSASAASAAPSASAEPDQDDPRNDTPGRPRRHHHRRHNGTTPQQGVAGAPTSGSASPSASTGRHDGQPYHRWQD